MQDAEYQRRDVSTKAVSPSGAGRDSRPGFGGYVPRAVSLAGRADTLPFLVVVTHAVGSRSSLHALPRIVHRHALSDVSSVVGESSVVVAGRQHAAVAQRPLRAARRTPAVRVLRCARRHGRPHRRHRLRHAALRPDDGALAVHRLPRRAHTTAERRRTKHKGVTRNDLDLERHRTR